MTGAPAPSPCSASPCCRPFSTGCPSSGTSPSRTTSPTCRSRRCRLRPSTSTSVGLDRAARVALADLALPRHADRAPYLLQPLVVVAARLPPGRLLLHQPGAGH